MPENIKSGSQLKYLHCSAIPLDPKLGMARHSLGIGQALRHLAWEVEFQTPADLGLKSYATRETYRKALFSFLKENSQNYDVIEYEHSSLPQPRNTFAKSTLLIARSFNLLHFLRKMSPARKSSLDNIKRAFLFSGLREQLELLQFLPLVDATLRSADLTAVSNRMERDYLVARGASPKKVIVSPPGVSMNLVNDFTATHRKQSNTPILAFVGTFDYRKGAADMPEIFSRVLSSFPSANFRLLGTAGLFPTKESVESFFPKSLRGHIEVVPRFEPNQLPTLLSDVWCGFFPSYYDSFGSGLVEMLALGIPVIAYASAGPSEILPESYLVRIGAADSLGGKLCDLLADSEKLERGSQWARERAKDFTWEKLGAETSRNYLEALQHLRSSLG